MCVRACCRLLFSSATPCFSFQKQFKDMRLIDIRGDFSKFDVIQDLWVRKATKNVSQNASSPL
jgi:hypothetical protein